MNDSNAVVIIDNGANTAKVGLSTYDDPLKIPNCIMKAKAERRRAFIGNQIDECRDASGLYYLLCFQKGYLLNWDVQKTVWDYIFSSESTGISLDDREVIITEPQLNFSSIQEAMVEILFEEYHCSGVCKTTTADLAAYNYAISEEIPMEACNCIVVDVGYSFTHIVPFVRGQKILEGIRRIDVGGKVLTNQLKEVISYRHLNMMDESYVVNQIKEDVCFVSQNFNEDMKLHRCAKKRQDIVAEYVLPDFTALRRGYIKGQGKKKETSEGNDVETDNIENDVEMSEEDSDHQTLRLGNERFTIPELFFNPSDIGINQMGIPESVINSLENCNPLAHRELLRNIIVIGGSASFPGFIPRLKREIRALAPDDLEVSLIYPEDPTSYGWYGGRELACRDELNDLILTREQYEETGYIATLNK